MLPFLVVAVACFSLAQKNRFDPRGTQRRLPLLSFEFFACLAFKAPRGNECEDLLSLILNTRRTSKKHSELPILLGARLDCRSRNGDCAFAFQRGETTNNKQQSSREQQRAASHHYSSQGGRQLRQRLMALLV